jgi:membrane-associated phospholipid phosphatase
VTPQVSELRAQHTGGRMAGGRTAVGPLWRELRRRFAEGRALIGEEAWRRWLLNIGAGMAVMPVVMFLLMRAAQAALAAGALDWETSFLERLGSDGPLGFSDAVFFQTFGTDITLVILLAATSGIAVWARRPITALSIWLAPLVVDLVGRLGWAMWDRARPDVLWDGVASPGFHSFPSGHTSKTLAAWGFLAIIWVLASRSVLERVIAVVLLAAIAIVVPLGRMTMGVHWPSDIIGGYVLATVWLAILARAHRRERRAIAQSVRSGGKD